MSKPPGAAGSTAGSIAEEGCAKPPGAVGGMLKSPGASDGAIDEGCVKSPGAAGGAPKSPGDIGADAEDGGAELFEDTDALSGLGAAT